MDSKGFLPVHLIATFPRVKNMTQDYAIVISAIESSELLELNLPEKTCLRGKTNPEKWPLRDIAAVPSPAPLPSIPFKTRTKSPPVVQEEKVSSDVSTTTTAEGTTEILNPNVAEFVPKSVEDEAEDSKSASIPIPSEGQGQGEENKEVDGEEDKSLEESWREVKRKPKPVVNKERKRTSLSYSGGGGAGDFSEELAFQFEEDTVEYTARGRNFSSSRYSL